MAAEQTEALLLVARFQVLQDLARRQFPARRPGANVEVLLLVVSEERGVIGSRAPDHYHLFSADADQAVSDELPVFGADMLIYDVIYMP
jgi:hypothetical protein